MAEADESAKDDATSEHTPKTPSSEPISVASPPTSNPQTEWTASDARGPLIEAHADAATESDTSADAPRRHAAEDSSGRMIPEAAGPRSNTPLSGQPAPETSGTPVVAEPQKKGSAWPIGIGIVGGAIIGAGIALFVDRSNSSDPQVAALADKVAALQTKSGTDPAVATLESKVAALQKTVSGLSKTAGSPAVFDPAPLQQDIAGLKTGLANLRKESAGSEGLGSKIDGLGTKLGALEGTVAGLQKQAAASQSSLQTLQTEQKSLAGKVGSPALAVVADSLVQAIDQGQPYAAQVDALTGLGADPVKLAVLKPNAQAGVASAKTLAQKFRPLAEPILATEHKAPPNAGFLERMKSGLGSLVSVRRTNDLSGTDLSSRVGRIQQDLTHDDLADALATWTALPTDAKAKSEAWGALLKASADTMATARGLQSDAIAAMSAKKS